MIGLGGRGGLAPKIALPALLLAALALSCAWPKREAWERAPLPAAGVESRRLVSGPPFHIDRVRFHSAELDEPRFFLALVPDGVGAVEDVLIFNHGWWDRPEDLLRELKVDRVYARLLAARKVRPAIIVLPDIRFSSYYRRNSGRFPFNQSLELIATEVSGLVSRRYGVGADRGHWSIRERQYISFTVR